MTVVRWFSAIAKRAEVWRVLDLSGITKSVRESQGFTKSGYVYLNGSLVTSLKETVEIGVPFRLEVRFPNGVVSGKDITVVNRMQAPGRVQRPNDPRTLNRKG